MSLRGTTVIGMKKTLVFSQIFSLLRSPPTVTPSASRTQLASVLHLLEEEESLVCYELEDTKLDIQLMFLKGILMKWLIITVVEEMEATENQIVHHSLSAIAVAYAMFTREGQLYTFMVLISEITTPEINMRWYVLIREALIMIRVLEAFDFDISYLVSCKYLDTAGLKRSSAHLINGVVIFFAWLVARILLFAYMFCHVYLHYDQ
ncbi:unnamed protein product [Camellia sinensis]